MKHIKVVLTCDECGKLIADESHIINIRARIEREYRGDRADVCSSACAEKWLHSLLHLLDHFDDDVENLSTDVWGGAGPDCRIVPA